MLTTSDHDTSATDGGDLTNCTGTVTACSDSPNEK